MQVLIINNLLNQFRYPRSKIFGQISADIKKLPEAAPYPVDLWQQQGYIPYHELQEIYNFAKTRVDEDRFFNLCGQKIAYLLFENELPDFFKAPVSTGKNFSHTIANLVRELINRHRLEPYNINISHLPDQITIELSHKNQTAMRNYLAKYNLDHSEAFQNSCKLFFAIFKTFWNEFISGGKIEISVNSYPAKAILRISKQTSFDYQKIANALTEHADKITGVP